MFPSWWSENGYRGSSRWNRIAAHARAGGDEPDPVSFLYSIYAARAMDAMLYAQP
jgi:hypothetical protein